ncbi:exodeoxyribonuclease V subunit gamma [Pseudobowmanella zhangzhouensis]|uniref:RecBCD enzyme subunit RecC n=1 Tax=Pseudobowmanella zhangzhouensis TaxID=1537679 RepID=A0ABW1XIF3_9ALTE
MLHLIQSNKMEVLAQTLCEVLRNSQLPVLQSQPILVQSPGMAQWLKLQVADTLGIAANLTFPLPSSYIWGLYQTFLPDVPRETALNKSAMHWKLLEMLCADGGASRYPQLGDYLLDDHTGLKCYQLSQKIADVFDHYLMYRPDWLHAWEQGETVAEISDKDTQQWQAGLWNELLHKTTALGQSTLHRSTLHLALLETLKSESAAGRLPAQLFVFGISALAPTQLQLLQAIAQHSEVYFFWFNPCQEYWADIVDQKQAAKLQLKAEMAAHAELFEVGNPLLASMGKLGRDFLSMLLAAEPQQADLFYSEPATSLLVRLQQDVLQLTQRNVGGHLSAQELFGNGELAPKLEIASDDLSLQLHACHSPVRELEILQDRLLSLFEQGQLTPGDVIVMMPDVAAYAPYIDAIFGAADSHLRIPYAIADRNAAEESPLLISFNQLNNLLPERLSLSDVMDMLAVPAILRQFQLSPAEHLQLVHWCAEAGVRWGLDGDDKARFNLPPETQNTWLFGLKRLLLGYCTGAHELVFEAENPIAPYPELEGQSVQALGKLLEFIDALTDLLLLQQTPRNLAGHVLQAQELLARFYLLDDDDAPYVAQLQRALGELAQQSENASVDISQFVFASALTEQLQSKGVGQRFLAGAVNFCTLMPMRSVPFKQVCLLGMNDQAYPRQTRPIGFDLVAKSPTRKGDRNRRVDDRYLFLEALLSARQGLYISYVGNHQRDNSELNPSSLVSELLEYCLQTFALEGQLGLAAKTTEQNLLAHLHTRHPLQPFNPAYFQAQRPQSFQSRYLQLLDVPRQQDNAFCMSPLPQIEPVSEIDLAQLIDFITRPARYFLRQRWMVRFTQSRDALKETEPFDLDGLEKYQLRDAIISRYVSGDDDIDKTFELLRASGNLSTGSGARVTFDTLWQQCRDMATTIRDWVNGQRPQRYNIAVNTQPMKLTGVVNRVYGNVLLHWHSGRYKTRYILGLWVEWLALCASNALLSEARLVCRPKNGNKPIYTVTLRRLSADQAQQHLADLLTLYQDAQRQPLLFFPDTAELYLRRGDRESCIAEYSREPSDKASGGEGQDINNRRICPDLSTQFDVFVTNAEVILQPVLANMEGN